MKIYFINLIPLDGFVNKRKGKMRGEKNEVKGLKKMFTKGNIEWRFILDDTTTYLFDKKNEL